MRLVRWQVIAGLGLPGLTLAGWWAWLQADSAPVLAPAPAVVHPVMVLPPPKLPPPPLNPPAGKELPPVKPGGTTWDPDPAEKPAPVEAQRGAPADVPGAQPLRPPPATTP